MTTNAAAKMISENPAEAFARKQLRDALEGLEKCVNARCDWLVLTHATDRIRDAVGALKRAQPPAPPVVPHGHCCLKARRFSCVCREALRCPEHGERHIGSHE
jgi:hypothetical protein